MSFSRTLSSNRLKGTTRRRGRETVSRGAREYRNGRGRKQSWAGGCHRASQNTSVARSQCKRWSQVRRKPFEYASDRKSFTRGTDVWGLRSMSFSTRVSWFSMLPARQVKSASIDVVLPNIAVDPRSLVSVVYSGVCTQYARNSAKQIKVFAGRESCETIVDMLTWEYPQSTQSMLINKPVRKESLE